QHKISVTCQNIDLVLSRPGAGCGQVRELSTAASVPNSDGCTVLHPQRAARRPSSGINPRAQFTNPAEAGCVGAASMNPSVLQVQRYRLGIPAPMPGQTPAAAAG